MINVLHVLKSNSYSGAEHVVCNIIQNMPDNYKCFYLSPIGLIRDKLNALHISYIAVTNLSIVEVQKAIRTQNINIIHAHDFSASIICAIATLGMKDVKVFSHIHCNPDWLASKNEKSFLYYFFSNRFNKIIVVSKAICEEYVYTPQIKTPMIVMGNPFSVQEIYNIVDRNRECDGEYLSDILYVGRLEDAKNPFLFLEIVKHLLKKGFNGKVRMVGDGSLKNLCEDYIIENGLSDIVQMVGFQNNPYVYMKNTKLQVITSKWEGFGLVALEAMAFGIPVVSSGVGGLSEIVDEDCGGNCFNVEEYVCTIYDLLTDTEKYQQKSKNAKKKAEKYDNINAYINHLCELYS